MVSLKLDETELALQARAIEVNRPYHFTTSRHAFTRVAVFVDYEKQLGRGSPKA